MREFTVELGGQQRKLRYTTTDAIALKKRFGKPAGRLCTQDVLGRGPDGKRNGDIDPEAQVALVALGLSHEGTRFSDDQVAEWFDEHMLAGKPIGEILQEAVNAAFYAGICTGSSVDLKKLVEEAEAEAAKAKGAKATPPAGPEEQSGKETAAPVTP